MLPNLDQFQEVWVADFEYVAAAGNNPSPVVCLCAKELRTGQRVQLWLDELTQQQCPFDTSSRSLFCGYYVSAEIRCFLVLGWSLPEKILDLYSEFRAHMNNRVTPRGSGLLAAMGAFGVPGISTEQKDASRDLILRGPPWDSQERQLIESYCWSDVEGASELLLAMLPRLSLTHALHRGRYAKAAAQIEHNGIPMDAATWTDLQSGWARIRAQLIVDVDQNYQVYEDGHFRRDRFESWLSRSGVPWPRHPSGVINLQDSAFRDMGKVYPEVYPLAQLHSTLGSMRANKLAIGRDNRNRTLLGVFGSTTARNQPKSGEYIFAQPVWLRSLIKPPEGLALVYADFSQQEFAIGAALSGDENMLAAYRSGDAYLAAAIQWGLAPPGASKKTHKTARDQAKIACLAVMYGMQAESLAQRLGCTPPEARRLLELHRQNYRDFWRWSDGVEAHALLRQRLWTVHGWPIFYGSDTAKANARSTRNFPVQGGGSDMLRAACIMLTESGIQVGATVHDAVSVECPVEHLELVVAQTVEIMAAASEKVLGSLALRSDVVRVLPPDRYRDERDFGPGKPNTWRRVMRLLYGPDGGGKL